MSRVYIVYIVHIGKKEYIEVFSKLCTYLAHTLKKYYLYAGLRRATFSNTCCAALHTLAHFFSLFS